MGGLTQIGQVKLLILRSIASYIVLTETNPQQLLINHFILLLLNLHVSFFYQISPIFPKKRSKIRFV